MKNMLLLAALLSAATASFAQTAAPAAPPATPEARQPGGPGHHARHAPPDARKMAERQVARLDTDKDGKVSLQEYLARQSEAFSKADANGDGFVTQEEMVARHEKHHAAMAGRARGSQDGQKPAAPAPAK
jgi:hypothetical protein